MFLLNLSTELWASFLMLVGVGAVVAAALYGTPVKSRPLGQPSKVQKPFADKPQQHSNEADVVIIGMVRFMLFTATKCRMLNSCFRRCRCRAVFGKLFTTTKSILYRIRKVCAMWRHVAFPISSFTSSRYLG
jgi:hypothetical protein